MELGHGDLDLAPILKTFGRGRGCDPNLGCYKLVGLPGIGKRHGSFRPRLDDRSICRATEFTLRLLAMPRLRVERTQGKIDILNNVAESI